MSEFDLAQFTKHLVQLSRQYPLFTLPKEAPVAYWDHLHEDKGFPLEALRQAIKAAPDSYPDIFPSAGQLGILARPIADKLRAEELEQERAKTARALPAPGGDGAAQALRLALSAVEYHRPLRETRPTYERLLSLLAVMQGHVLEDDVYQRTVVNDWAERGYAPGDVVRVIRAVADRSGGLPSPLRWRNEIEGERND